MKYSKLLNNFNILEKININDKLYLMNDSLYINKPSILRPITRSIYKQSREKLYIHLILMVDQIIIELDKFNIYELGKSNYKLNQLNIKTFEDYKNAYLKLTNFNIYTIDILKETYKNDIQFVRKLELLKSLINNSNPNIKKYNIKHF